MDACPNWGADVCDWSRCGFVGSCECRIFTEKNSGYTIAHLGGVVSNSIVWGDWRSHYFGVVKPVASALGGICHCHACDSLCRDDFVICLFQAKQFQRTGM